MKRKNILGTQDVYMSQAPSLVIIVAVVAVGCYSVEAVVVMFVHVEVVVDPF